MGPDNLGSQEQQARQVVDGIEIVRIYGNPAKVENRGIVMISAAAMNNLGIRAAAVEQMTLGLGFFVLLCAQLLEDVQGMISPMRLP